MSAARTGRQCRLDSRSSFESQQICGTKFVRSAVFSFVVCFVIAGRGYAAQTDTSAKQKESPPVRVDVPQSSQQFPNALPAGAEVPAAGYPTTSAQQSVNSSTSSRRGAFVIAPIPSLTKLSASGSCHLSTTYSNWIKTTKNRRPLPLWSRACSQRGRVGLLAVGGTSTSRKTAFAF